MAGFTFEPEVVERTSPEERRQRQRARSSRVMSETAEQLGKAAPKFNMAKFIKDFANPLLQAYNANAKSRGLPLATEDWYEILAKMPETKDPLGYAVPPKDFLTKNRAALQPRLFPGDPAKAAKAYDVLIAAAQLPYVASLPVSGILGHELGHTETAYGDPDIQMAPHGPKGKTKLPVETAVNEAVASYRGFQLMWTTWSKFGIPRKAWGAWAGFPQYVTGLTSAQIADLESRLKALDSKYPRISALAHAVIYNYEDYVRPVLYNVPGKDWTTKEKVALQRFLKSRGGTYRESLPKDQKEQLKHLYRQPYVKAPTAPPTSAVAKALPPLSKRAWPPLSCREGEE